MALLDGEADALTRKALVPPRKDTPVSIDLPPVKSAEDTVAASSAVLAAVGAGDITPEEAGRLMTLLTAHRAIVEIGDLERRLAALEATK
jgi:hypothetical protein